MSGTIGDTLPFALAITVSPLPIVGEILLLFSEKPGRNGSAYLGGFLVGLGGLLAVLITAAAGADLAGSESGVNKGMAGVQVAIGLALAFGGLRRLRAGAPPIDLATGEPEMPKWMTRLEGASPFAAAGIGVTIGALNPKNIAVVVPTAIAIAGASAAATDKVVSAAVWLAVASLGVAVPLVVAVAMGERATPTLESWRTWLVRNNKKVMGILFLIIAAVLLANGIPALRG